MKKTADYSLIESYALSPIHIGPHGDVFFAIERLHKPTRRREIIYKPVSHIGRAISIITNWEILRRLPW